MINMLTPTCMTRNRQKMETRQMAITEGVLCRAYVCLSLTFAEVKQHIAAQLNLSDICLTLSRLNP